MLDDAIEVLPPAKLLAITGKYIDLDLVRPDADTDARPDLLAAVRHFERASLAGEYYRSFAVNSKSYTEQSAGTTAWIAECRRLLDRCVTAARHGDRAEARQAFDIIFGLLDHLDECLDDVVFFADEGSSWQVGVDWGEVLPPWFGVLAATAPPEEYAERITSLLEHHYSYGRDDMLAVARKTATPEQREALAAAADRKASRRRGGTKP